MKLKKILTFLAALSLYATVVQAQAATVIFNYPNTVSAAVVQGYTATLYVNGTPFVLTDVCVLVTTVTPNVVQCTAPLPNVTAALTASGPQNFDVTLADVILEGAHSVPFVLARPSVTSNLRIQ